MRTQVNALRLPLGVASQAISNIGQDRTMMLAASFRLTLLLDRVVNRRRHEPA